MANSSCIALSPGPVFEATGIVRQVSINIRIHHLQQKIVPIGVIEQHGYHLPLKTDALIASGLGKMIGQRTGILKAPTMYQSFSGGGLPGTINISPATMSLVVSDTLLSLACQGFRNFFLLLCHGGSENARALDDAMKLLLRMNPAFSDAMIALFPVWKLGSSEKGWSKAISDHDWHAGWLETSMVMALEPDLVRMERLTVDSDELMSLMHKHPDNYQRSEKIVDDEFVIPRMTQREDIHVGVMGAPEKASPELGKEIVEDIVEFASRKIQELESKADGVYKEVDFSPEPLLF